MDVIQNNKTMLIHIGVELVLVTSIAFWLNSKISSKDETIAKLEKENKEILARLANIEAFLSQAMGKPVPPPPKKESPKKVSNDAGSDDESIIESEDHDINLE